MITILIFVYPLKIIFGAMCYSSERWQFRPGDYGCIRRKDRRELYSQSTRSE